MWFQQNVQVCLKCDLSGEEHLEDDQEQNSRKILILSLVSKFWSYKQMQEEFQISQYQIRNARLEKK